MMMMMMMGRYETPFFKRIKSCLCWAFYVCVWVASGGASFRARACKRGELYKWRHDTRHASKFSRRMVKYIWYIFFDELYTFNNLFCDDELSGMHHICTYRLLWIVFWRMKKKIVGWKKSRPCCELAVVYTRKMYKKISRDCTQF